MTSDPDMDALMDMPSRRNGWNMFVTMAQWCSVLGLVILAYPTMTISLGVNWLVSVIVLVMAGAGAGAALKLGRGFNLALTVLVAMAVLIQLIIALVKILL